MSNKAQERLLYLISPIGLIGEMSGWALFKSGGREARRLRT